MKKIDTLVADIYELFESGKVDRGAFGVMLKAPEPPPEDYDPDKPYLRMSNLGTTCERELWYLMNKKSEGEKLKAPQYIKFTFGDILESMLLNLAVQAGHTVEGTQDRLDIEGIKGHRDAIIDGELVDVKSASTFSFKKFEKGLTPEEDAFGYLVQQNLYLEASKNDPRLLNKGRYHFLVIDKTLGNLCLDTHAKDNRDWQAFVRQKKDMAANKEAPLRGFKEVPVNKSGNMGLATKCSYCAFKQSCWPGLKTYYYASGPVYLTKVVKEPNVAGKDF